MKKLICLPLIVSMGMLWGCGSTEDQPEFDRSELDSQCDYLLATYHNSDELVQCQVAMTACSDFEMSRLIQKWSCDLGEPTQEECYVDENGEPLSYEVDTTPECAEAQAAVLPEDNGFWEVIDSIANGKLAGTNWCGPGDKKTDTKGVTGTVDASCRRHDHGYGYSTQPWWLLSMPKAFCRVDGDIVSGAQNAGYDGRGNYNDNGQEMTDSRHDFAVWSIATVFGQGSIFYCQGKGWRESCSGGWWWRSSTRLLTNNPKTNE